MRTNYFKYLFTIYIVTLVIDSFAQDRVVIHEHTPKSALICARSNTDTVEFTHNKQFKPASSRVSADQLSINFSKHFYQAFPNKKVSNNISLVFELTIEKDGSINGVSVLRSNFTSEENDKLKEIIYTITADTWIPASYKGEKITSQYTLPIILLADVNEI